MRARPGRIGVLLWASLTTACATLVGLEEPTDTPEQPDGAVDAAPVSEDTSPPLDASTDEASIDAAREAAPACTATGQPCSTMDGCCTKKCGEAKVCLANCGLGVGATCQFGLNNCCVGYWCGGGEGDKCIACYPAGQDAFFYMGDRIEESCCSRKVNPSNGKCLP